MTDNMFGNLLIMFLIVASLIWYYIIKKEDKNKKIKPEVWTKDQPLWVQEYERKMEKERKIEKILRERRDEKKPLFELKSQRLRREARVEEARLKKEKQAKQSLELKQYIDKSLSEFNKNKDLAWSQKKKYQIELKEKHVSIVHDDEFLLKYGEHLAEIDEFAFELDEGPSLVDAKVLATIREEIDLQDELLELMRQSESETTTSTKEWKAYLTGDRDKIIQNLKRVDSVILENHKKSMLRVEQMAPLAAIVYTLIVKHIDTLIMKWNQTVSKDDYGKFIYDKWFKEVEYFIDNIIMENEDIALRLSDNEHQVLITLSIKKKISVLVEMLVCLDPAVDKDVTSLTGEEFEHYCAKELLGVGWDAHVTKSSGDQGVDVVAKKNGVKVVLQCKLYSKPVGNAAVQEILAGKSFYSADFAAVVTNNTYTQSAKQLSYSTGVLIMHHSELCKLADMVGE